jgi:hypothetical protein
MFGKTGIFALVAAGVLGVAGQSVFATSISATLTADNSFTVFLSPVATVDGTSFGSGTDWTTTYNFNQTLTPGVTQYLHVTAANSGGPQMFIGQFDLSDTGFMFADGSQRLLTGSSLLTVSTTGYASGFGATADLGVNGTSPWGMRPSIDPTARFVWASDLAANPVFFSAAIVPTGVTVPGAVPEPTSLVLTGIAVAGLLVRRRRAVE